jgi:hypothetical protein
VRSNEMRINKKTLFEFKSARENIFVFEAVINEHLVAVVDVFEMSDIDFSQLETLESLLVLDEAQLYYKGDILEIPLNDILEKDQQIGLQ